MRYITDSAFDNLDPIAFSSIIRTAISTNQRPPLRPSTPAPRSPTVIGCPVHLSAVSAQVAALGNSMSQHKSI